MKNVKNIQFGKLAMIAAIAFMATSCQQDEVLDQYDPKPQGEIISFHIQRGWDFDKISRSTGTQYGEHISDNNLLSEDNSESMKMGVYQQPIDSWFGGANSRGTMIQSADFSEFLAFGYKTKTENGTATTTPIFVSSYHDITNNKTDKTDDAGWEKPVGTGKDANGYYWPGSDYTCSFFGISMSDGKLTDTTSGTSVYNNVTTKKNTAGQIIGFDYTVPALAVNQPDIMVAAANNIPGDGSSESVSLDFKHILTAVNVKVGVKTGETTMPNGKITSIKFKNIYGKGTYSVETNAWSGFREWANGDGTAGSTGIGLQEYSVDLGDEGYKTNGITQNTQINTVNATFMMLPQSLPSNAVIEIEYLHDGYETPVKLSAPIGGSSWNMGVETNYLINISPDNNLMFVSAITPKDAHYIMVDFNIKAQDLTEGWKMKASASDGSSVTLRTELTDLQSQGYWTVNERGEPTITKTTSGTEVKVWAFVEENLGSTDRTITLELYNAATNELADTKTFTQLCMSSARSERLQETGEVPWGFKWDRKVTYHAAPYIDWNNVSWNNIGNTLKNLFAAVLFNSIGQDIAKKYPDAVETGVLTVKPHEIWFLITINDYTDITIDYGKLDNLGTIAQSDNDGLTNTDGLYYFKGIASISDLETLLDNEKAGFAANAVTKKEEGTLTDNSYISNFAAKSCIMKNKFYAEQKTVEEDGGSRTYYVPVLSSEETASKTDNFNYLNWYLPASTEYAGINTAEGTGAYKLDGVYWTSTAVADDNVNSYIYTSGTGEDTDDRMTPHLVRCKRKQ